MRFVVLVKATEASESGALPSREQLAEMGKFNEQLIKDGVMLAGEGLHASSKGARLRFDQGRTTVTDGPFAETKELVAGFWIVQGKSKEEVVERFTHAPFDGGAEIEIRQIHEFEDLGDLVTPEHAQARRAFADRSAPELQRAIEAVWRIESPKLIATLARMLQDIGRAEDIAQDAFVTALDQWPQTGIPRNPGAWLMTAAKRRAIDLLRREKTLGRKTEAIGANLQRSSFAEPDVDEEPEAIDDDVLRLMFVACHPLLNAESRVALTLRLLGGLTVAEISRAFLLPESTIAQRIVRAKRTIAKAGVPFEVPTGVDRAARVATVLEAIYLIFNEGYAATSGDDVLRPELVQDALRLGRMLAALMPEEAEAHALSALMELHASRMRARVGPSGEPILLADQDRGRWNHLFIGRGLEALGRAQALNAGGPYALQAAIAAEHARASSAERTDWTRIASLYAQLAGIMPSPVVELNRAVAVGMAQGPAAALPLVERLLNEPALRTYHLLPSVRADLLFKLDRFREAGDEFERAARMASNARDRALLLDRASACRNRRPSFDVKKKD